MSRILCWFSCGAASAVALKLAVEQHGPEVEALYCDTLKYEHPDNTRFMADVEAWVGVKVKLLKHPKYADIFEVFRGERYIVGVYGAPCTKALKRNVRKAYQEPSDTHIFGLTACEGKRITRFEEQNKDLWLEWNLRDAGVTKNDCYERIKAAGIELPAMYRLGYNNNNCIGCVKGGAGYWNKIRVDFPEHFKRMALLEREIGACICKEKGKRVYLDELSEGVGRYDPNTNMDCGVLCEMPTTQAELDLAL